MHRKKSCSMLSSSSWDNIAQVKTQCNVVLEALDTNAPEKILLSGQHCTDKNLVRCYPRGSRQKCKGKNPV